MAREIIIRAGDTTLEAVLDDSATADAVWDLLPLEVQGSTWGDELYFALPEELTLKPENAGEVIEIGDIGYWPPGNAFCIFFGPTPVSIGDEPRAASPVNVFGKVTGDATELEEVRSGEMIIVEKKG